MKPATFEYYDPTDIDSALSLLAKSDVETKVLAGGQSLVPLMNFRLSRPQVLVDINRLTELAYIHSTPEGLAIGALTRHSQLLESPLIQQHYPVLIEAVRHVGHVQIRNRGTVGGSVMHADPAAELPCVLAALDARFVLLSERGRRIVPWGQMFQSVFTTAAEPDELLIQIEVPPLASRTGYAFEEFARRHGDFALAGACALLTVASDGRCIDARISLLAAGPVPVRAAEAEKRLVGSHLLQDDLNAAAALAEKASAPTGDIHGSRDYRLRLLVTMASRALARAATTTRELK